MSTLLRSLIATPVTWVLWKIWEIGDASYDLMERVYDWADPQ